MTKILQLTDLHVFAEPGETLKGIPTRECLQDVVDHILQNEVAFDHVVITGDHTHDELPASYAAVKDILRPLTGALWQVPGNHDDRAVLASVFPDALRTSSGHDKINFRFEADQWLCVGLDTHVPGQVAGSIDQDQVTWLQQLMQSSSVDRVALFFHHPPLDLNSVWMDAIGLAHRERLLTLLESDDRIRLICCGHVHHQTESRIGKATIVTTPSTGIQFNPEGEVPAFAADAPGWRILEFSGDGFTTRVDRLPKTRFIPVDGD